MASDKTVKFSIVGEDKATPAVKTATTSLDSLEKKITGGTSKALDELGTKSQGLGSKLSALSTKGASSAMDELQGHTGALGSKLQSLGANAESAFGGLASSLPVVGAAVAGVVAVGEKLIGNFQDQAQSVLHFKEVTGETADESSRWIAAFDDYGISADQASSLVGKFAKVVGGSPTTLKAYGVSIATAKDGTTDLNQTTLNAIDTLNKTSDPAKRAAAGAALFGKSWQDMAKVIDAGGDEVKATYDKVSGGRLLSQDDLSTSEQLRKAIDDIENSAQGLELTLAKTVVPTVAELAQEIGKVTGAVDDLLGPIGGVGPAFATAFKYLDPIGQAFSSVSDAVDLLKGSYSGLGGPFDKSNEQLNTAIGLGDKLKDSTDAATGSIRAAQVADEDFGASAQQTAEDVKAYSDRVKDAADLEKRQADATKQAEDALRSKQEATLASFNSEIQLDQAVLGVGTALHAQGTTADDMKSKILGAAAAAAQYAQDQAEAAGKTFDTNDKIAAETAELQSLKAKFPELSGVIDDYITKLGRIPRTITTTVTVDQRNVGAGSGGAGGKTAVASASGHHFASGGDVLAWVGETGPELVALPDGSTVFPASTSAQAMRLAAGLSGGLTSDSGASRGVNGGGLSGGAPATRSPAGKEITSGPGVLDTSGSFSDSNQMKVPPPPVYGPVGAPIYSPGASDTGHMNPDGSWSGGSYSAPSTSSGSSAAGGSAGPGGVTNVFEVTVNASIGNGPQIGQAVVNALAGWCRANGPLPRLLLGP